MSEVSSYLFHHMEVEEFKSLVKHVGRCNDCRRLIAQDFDLDPSSVLENVYVRVAKAFLKQDYRKVVGLAGQIETAKKLIDDYPIEDMVNIAKNKLPKKVKKRTASK